jgi:hypothetical protein
MAEFLNQRELTFTDFADFPAQSYEISFCNLSQRSKHSGVGRSRRTGIAKVRTHPGKSHPLIDEKSGASSDLFKNPANVFSDYSEHHKKYAK